MAQLVKNPPVNAGDMGLIPGLGRSPGKGKGYPLQYSGLENSMDYTVHGVTKSQTRLSNFCFHFFAFMPSSRITESYDSSIFSFFKEALYCSP